MEKDMALMSLSPQQKHYLRDRWRQNESDYLRERRQKLSPSAFVKLKTIGHGNSFFSPRLPSHPLSIGAFGVVSLVREKSAGNLYAMKQVSHLGHL